MNKLFSIFFLILHLLTAACGSQEVSIPPAAPSMNIWVRLPAEKQTRVVCYFLYQSPRESIATIDRAVCRDEDLGVCWYEKGNHRRGYAFGIPCEKLEAWVGPDLEQ